MTWLLVLLGLALGAAAAATHLVATRGRAWLVTHGHPGLALASFPLGLLGPGLCALAAIAAGPVAAWSLLPGLFLTRQLALARVRPD